MLLDLLKLEGVGIGRKHVTTLMKKMGIEALDRKTYTSRRIQAHRIYPYRLRNLITDHPNQVRVIGTTYFPMQTGFFYLSTVLDWTTRRVLAWRQTAVPCIETLKESILKYGAPETMNTNQDNQLTSSAFPPVFKQNKIQISIDDNDCWRHSIFVERLWKSVKYEEVYLHAYETVSIARQALKGNFDFYNRRRPHSTLDGMTADTAYFNLSNPLLAAVA